MKQSSKPYACKICNESFSTAKSLVSHAQTKHVPIKPSETSTEKEGNSPSSQKEAVQKYDIDKQFYTIGLQSQSDDMNISGKDVASNKKKFSYQNWYPAIYEEVT